VIDISQSRSGEDTTYWHAYVLKLAFKAEIATTF
jgi:hypothetical protein